MATRSMFVGFAVVTFFVFFAEHAIVAALSEGWYLAIAIALSAVWVVFLVRWLVWYRWSSPQRVAAHDPAARTRTPLIRALPFALTAACLVWITLSRFGDTSADWFAIAMPWLASLCAAALAVTLRWPELARALGLAVNVVVVLALLVAPLPEATVPLLAIVLVVAAAWPGGRHLAHLLWLLPAVAMLLLHWSPAALPAAGAALIAIAALAAIRGFVLLKRRERGSALAWFAAGVMAVLGAAVTAIALGGTEQPWNLASLTVPGGTVGLVLLAMLFVALVVVAARWAHTALTSDRLDAGLLLPILLLVTVFAHALGQGRLPGPGGWAVFVAFACIVLRTSTGVPAGIRRLASA